MKTFEQVEADVRMLSLEKQKELRDWLENLIRSGQDVKEGGVQVRKRNEGLVELLLNCPPGLVIPPRE